MSALLKLRNLSVTIAGNEIVHGIDLDVARGETLALVGESGSGKSMMAMALMGISPPGAVVRADEISFDSGKSPAALRGDRLSMVFQRPVIGRFTCLTGSDCPTPSRRCASFPINCRAVSASAC